MGESQYQQEIIGRKKEKAEFMELDAYVQNGNLQLIFCCVSSARYFLCPPLPKGSIPEPCHITLRSNVLCMVLYMHGHVLQKEKEKSTLGVKHRLSET